MTIRGPLNSVRILDLSQAHAGPYGSQILGDLGAEVIKIEPPRRGDIARALSPNIRGEGYYTLALNRNKKSVALDLYTESGKEAFHDLVGVSDVVFDNFKTGVTERLGVDFETLKKINPEIISCSITGYGPSGPYKSRSALDDIVQGIAGSISLLGDADGSPLRPVIPIADLSGGFFGAMGVVVALYKRQKTGGGVKVEVNLLECTMSLMSNHFQMYFLSGKPPQLQGKRHPAAPLGVFQTRNGYMTLGISWPNIAHLLNKSWLLEDPRFATKEKRLANKRELEGIMEEAFLEKDTEEWLGLFEKNDIMAGPINSLDAVEQDPHVIHNETIINMDHPLCGPIKAVATPIHIENAIHGQHEPPATLGQHTDEVLKSLLGYSDEKMKNLREEGEKHAGELAKHVKEKV
ncbi:MAG: CoA transferase [Desulfatiglans sp.]|jgi:crotonobetainyl-CoA:carnitine CoA-transferase CaiB-like acyl-CoA transferase|nr:CoA transferase [Thermodesulfobacteriota bacterium]MEE4354697.1 CoA transferase [Desulfatiglans sp.]